MSRVWVASLGFAVLNASAAAEIDYRVKVNAVDKRYEVTIQIPAPNGLLSLQMPKWSPGAYVLRGVPEVHDVVMTGATGKVLNVLHPDDSTWTVDAFGAGPVTVHYWLPTRGGRGGGFGRPVDDSFFQLSGPSVYMYLVGRKQEKCKVTFDVPSGWPVMVGLDAVGDSKDTFTAPTYDVLADNPMSTGQVIVDHYNLRGKDHYIVLEGAAKSEVNREKLIKDCRFVSAAETDFFGGAPYHKYVWHFIVNSAPDGAGGLEHLSSTQISLSSGEGPRAQSVLAHEFFHLWNVKRTRSKVLGPFDYQVLPKTGALWWLEGVTDYYATLLPYRYGEWTRPQMFDGIVNNLRAIKNNPARLTVSPNDASLRVGDANEGRGNSNGFQISYYNLGWLSGLCLDTEIRAQTGGKHSLDDVTRALFNMCKNDRPGFAEDEIRKQCIRFGGPSLGDFYDRVVMRPGEMPVGEQLAKMGLLLQERPETFVDAGFNAAGGPGGRGVRVGQVRRSAEGKVQAGDILKSIDGVSLEAGGGPEVAAVLRSHIEGAKLGTPIVLVLTRGSETVNVTVDPVESTRTIRSVVEDPAASPAAISLREQWLKTKTPSVP